MTHLANDTAAVLGGELSLFATQTNRSGLMRAHTTLERPTTR